MIAGINAFTVSAGDKYEQLRSLNSSAILKPIFCPLHFYQNYIVNSFWLVASGEAESFDVCYRTVANTIARFSLFMMILLSFYFTIIKVLLKISKSIVKYQKMKEESSSYSSSILARTVSICIWSRVSRR